MSARLPRRWVRSAIALSALLLLAGLVAPADAAPGRAAAGPAVAAGAQVAVGHRVAPALPAVPAAPARRVVHLTFDDGPWTGSTAAVLRELARYRARATFFVVGQQAARHPKLVRAIRRGGHSVQNHTWSHPSLTRLAAAALRSQVRRTDRAARAAGAGIPTPACVRPPYGATNRTVRARLAALGKRQVLWTVDPRDWARPGSATIVRRVLSAVRPGSVVLLHDGGGNRSQTVAALRTVLRTLSARGYAFTSLCR